MKMDDPVIDEIRKTRMKISERFQHDPKKLVEYYIEMQNQSETINTLEDEKQNQHSSNRKDGMNT